jgi:O-antigen ligase
MLNSVRKLYFILLIIAPLSPRLGAVDRVAADWLFYAFAGFFGIVATAFFNHKIFDKINDKKFFYPLVFHAALLLSATISIIFALNKVESLVTLIKLFIIFINLYVIYTLRVYKINLNFILYPVLVLFTIEIVSSLYPLFIDILPVTKFEFNYTSYLLGITANRNITAASILVKLPLIIILLKEKSLLARLLLYVLFFLCFINILFLSSRAGIISLLFIIFSKFIFDNFQNIKNFNLRKILSSSSLVFIFIASYLFFNSNIESGNQVSLNQRLESINLQDESASIRIRFYKQALTYFIQNPFTPIGLGNWKLYSIYLEKENIRSYIIPYVVHNDFLEILVETSIIGVLSYILFFISLLVLLHASYKKLTKYKKQIYLLFIALLVYLIDSNLNFPFYRPIMQINLAVIFILILHYYKKINIYNE